MPVINPHLTEDVSRSPQKEKQLNTQYQKRQRYAQKYGAGSMRSLRSYYRRAQRTGEVPAGTSFRKWLRSVDSWDGTFSPKAEHIRMGG